MYLWERVYPRRGQHRQPHKDVSMSAHIEDYALITRLFQAA